MKTLTKHLQNGSSLSRADLPGAEHFVTQGGVATDKSITSYCVSNKLCPSAQMVMFIHDESMVAICEKGRVKFSLFQIIVSGF